MSKHWYHEAKGIWRNIETGARIMTGVVARDGLTGKVTTRYHAFTQDGHRVGDYASRHKAAVALAGHESR